MKLTIKKLKQIIKEELSLVLEYHDDEQFPSPEERRKAYLKNLAFLQKQGFEAEKGLPAFLAAHLYANIKSDGKPGQPDVTFDNNYHLHPVPAPLKRIMNNPNSMIPPEDYIPMPRSIKGELGTGLGKRLSLGAIKKNPKTKKWEWGKVRKHIEKRQDVCTKHGLSAQDMYDVFRRQESIPAKVAEDLWKNCGYDILFMGAPEQGLSPIATTWTGQQCSFITEDGTLLKKTPMVSCEDAEVLGSGAKDINKKSTNRYGKDAVQVTLFITFESINWDSTPYCPAKPKIPTEPIIFGMLGKSK